MLYLPEGDGGSHYVPRGWHCCVNASGKRDHCGTFVEVVGFGQERFDFNPFNVNQQVFVVIG